MKEFVAAIDQGTTSTRFAVFDEGGNEIARDRLEHAQIFPRPGPVEHNPLEILERTEAVVLGCDAAAGLAAGFWKELRDLRKYWKADRNWFPR